ncbi:MAG: hypothetical protein HC926_04340 [Synechococcaceae cyanobacterium SM2_3_60]|nr:hypothetical protein [Synechococcaceae cyanobacterium SM2_3_60]
MSIASAPFLHLHTRLISQLDSLVPFLSLAHAEVYQLLDASYSMWLPVEVQSTLPDNIGVFQTQIAHAGFLLGYSYIETFVTDVITALYTQHPERLPKDKALRYHDILAIGHYDGLIIKMIERTVARLNSLERKVKHLEIMGLNVAISNELLAAHHIRHTLIHNAGIVNRSLPYHFGWQIGDRITLSVAEVNGFGIAARNFAATLIQCITDNDLTVVDEGAIHQSVVVDIDVDDYIR